MTNILERVTAHRRALAAILPVCVALHHSANPTNGLKIEKIFAGPVLLSGLASLVLSTKEIGVIDRHHRMTLCRIQKLSRTTPDCVVFFLAGSLPATALLHLRQLGLLGMVARMEANSPLQQVGRQALLSNGRSKSWFQLLRKVSSV